ncbi:MAG: hypothetical protein IJY27_04265 [Clostridia bacterium]|nr:hypothetical protein [Clostridia bacterium]
MENQKNYFIAIIMVVVIAVVFSVASFAVTLGMRSTLDELVSNSEDLGIEVSKLITVDTTTASKAMFMLKEYNGVIGVFDEAGVLTDIIEVDIKSLPEKDRTMLGTGIWAFSRQELAALIEDYTG